MPGLNIESIDVLRAALTPEEFKGFCKGNALKYLIRAGKKDDELQDLKKAGVLMLRVLANQNRSDEWYTPENVVRQMLDLFPPPKGGTILCPFDTADSNFVKVLQENCDNKVVYGVRDFMTRDYQFDYLITNPPFSYKDRIIERCINTGKPCVLLLPLDTLGGAQTA